MRVFIEFDTKAMAIKYRHDNGCGGWILASFDGGRSILFPLSMTATQCLVHPIANGLSCELLP